MPDHKNYKKKYHKYKQRYQMTQQLGGEIPGEDPYVCHCLRCIGKDGDGEEGKSCECNCDCKSGYCKPGPPDAFFKRCSHGTCTKKNTATKALNILRWL